ncbi:desulfoferrodoxin family protein [Butyricicoccus faecihominis]|uniref:desulfoferrodoxin family protein n=1 Tax=Butyricicoccaceae TaxID=3085642 RepID=UPI002478CE74|nr:MULTISPECIES: desulfoferrodoxin family protein [Butyricicoccaceae]MCQ5129087.1 desulfoferrodoxin family protein [Butyricicoccus faecihominis]WNX84753.1 desulfoferrodoxin family protein [Agathobaculum sp. NTUH-O15-33]
MATELKLFRCAICGNIVEMVEDHGVPLMCCGKKMDLMKAGSTDAAQEKHVPVVTVANDKVTASVGEVTHPMGDEHHISWIILETDKGVYRRKLPHDGEPVATFCLHSEKPIAVYEFCNLHGLWKKDL